MISKITISVVKKNLPVLKCVGLMDKYKIMHSFSDNNKKSNIFMLLRSFLKIQKRLITKKFIATSKELRSQVTQTINSKLKY